MSQTVAEINLVPMQQARRAEQVAEWAVREIYGRDRSRQWLYRRAFLSTVSRSALDHMNRALIRSGKLGGLYTPVIDAAHARTKQIIEQAFSGKVRDPKKILETPEAHKLVRAVGEHAVKLEAAKAAALAAGMAAIETAQKKPN